MLKLLLCLLCGLVVAVVCLQLRQQQLDLRNRMITLQARIEQQQARLWSQQVQISVYTSPGVLSRTVADLPLAPEAGLPPEAAHWVRVEP
jgi:cell division protein FtsL